MSDFTEADVDWAANLIAAHDAYHVNGEGWTVCICGHVAEGDDNDGSHARHVADVTVRAMQARWRKATADWIDGRWHLRPFEIVEHLRTGGGCSCPRGMNGMKYHAMNCPAGGEQ